MGLQCGIVGLPNVGKSTLFNALNSGGAEAANYPFCTIEPNKGVVNVPDQVLEQISDIVQPEKHSLQSQSFSILPDSWQVRVKGRGWETSF